jgi:cytochrome c oxidase assembly protein subunit 15
MNSNKAYIRFTWWLAISVFIVILAGSVVRMTQSGMGCPDWPKCFGRWIPPTNASQLPPDFEKYLKKQDIDHTFNAYHTWIEYINRLSTALLGLWIMIHVIWSYRKFFTTRRVIFWLSLSFLFLTGFEAWLGKVVVDTNLAVVKITLHMLLALLIAAVAILIVHKLDEKPPVENAPLKWISTVALLLLLIQIIIGTDVREQIDEISKALHYEQRELWIDRVDIMFIVHRSFSWVIAASGIVIFWKSFRVAALKMNSLFILSLIVVLMILGGIMAHFNIPALVQPMHMLFSSILAITLLWFRLKLK